MKPRFVKALLAGVVALIFGSAAPDAKAQEIQLTGPLKGAPAVRHLRYYRQGRFEIAPAVSFTLLDEYRRTIFTGARLEYNITDWLAIGLWAAYGAVSTTTDLTDKIDQIAPRDTLTATNVNHATTDPNNLGTRSFADQVAKMQYVAAPQVTFTPFRGKLAIFNKIFVDSDFYISGGVGVVGVQERQQCGPPKALSCADPASFALASDTKISPTFGAGFTFYPGGFWSLGVEYRALPFAWNRAGFDTRGGGPNGAFPDGSVTDSDSTFKFNQLITIAIGFYIPTQPNISE